MSGWREIVKEWRLWRNKRRARRQLERRGRLRPAPGMTSREDWWLRTPR